jgi:hypothetical protein
MKPARETMKKLPQLTQLIFSYYRENSKELVALQPLMLCKLSRRWGAFIIICPTLDVYVALLGVQDALKEPLVQLRLAKKVRIGIDKHPEVEVFSIDLDKSMTWEQAFKKAKLYR